MTYTHALQTCIPNRNWRWTESAHLIADTKTELDTFAAKIGLRAGWAQRRPDGTFYHYDLNPRRYTMAIAAGAQELPLREFVAKVRALYPFCLLCKRPLTTTPRPELPPEIAIQIDCKTCDIHAVGATLEEAVHHLNEYAARRALNLPPEPTQKHDPATRHHCRP